MTYNDIFYTLELGTRALSRRRSRETFKEMSEVL